MPLANQTTPNPNHYLQYVAQKTKLNTVQIKTVIDLLKNEECTIPFITRYRKEATGGLDEVQIQNIEELYDHYQEREKRRDYILKKLESDHKLTEKTKNDLLKAETLVQLEGIYAPFKVKRKTKGALAKEKNLGPLALMILNGQLAPPQMSEQCQQLLDKDPSLESHELIESGVRDIIIEMIANHVELKEELRKICQREGTYRSSKRKNADDISEFEKYKDYFEFEQKISQLKLEKNAHRYLAMRRGMNAKVLKIELIFEFEDVLSLFRKYFLKKQYQSLDILKKCCEKAFKNYIHPSLDLEYKNELKQDADLAAINVFGINLKNLLLMPYLGAKKVIGIDPGIRTGCKVVVIDDTGKYLEDTVIYPFPPKNQKKEAKETIKKLIEKHQISHLAIGNGTYGRETLEFVEGHVLKLLSQKCHATIISESGASIYSTSEVGRKEFPALDPVVRGAISIARRFQDPLAELVKIDAKSIGVGQYQHDVNQSKLNKSLHAVVENCVNYVGVDVNTASAPLLSYISGIGPTLAKNIVSQREKEGAFKNRQELMKVARFSDKAFLLSAGFLKIYKGDNPLDSTFIHPEKYNIIEDWSKMKGVETKKIVKNSILINELQADHHFEEKVGPYTLKDIIQSLSSPDKDPREEFKSMEFRSDLATINDLKINEWYPGVVTNLTNFGAFIDLGIKENGLLHLSEMSNQFVKNPMDILKVGEQVSVKIKDIDHKRKRISLSRKDKGEGEK